MLRGSVNPGLTVETRVIRRGSGLRTGNSMRGALEDDAEDGVIGDLAAEGVEGGENLIAFCLTGPGSDQNGVGELGEDEGVGEYGGGAVDDDEAEVIAPRGEQACHARGGDEFGRTGRASAGVTRPRAAEVLRWIG